MKRLSDVAVIEVGFAFPSKAFGEVGNGPRLVRGDNIGHGSLRWGEATTWAWPGEAPDAKYELAEHDLVIGMDRPWISAGVKFATVTRSDLPALLVQRVARIRARAGVSQRFLRYVISHPSYAEYIQSVQTGTSIPHVSATQIGAYPLPHSEDVNAIRIAEVLGALDDKIATNRSAEQLAASLSESLFDRACRAPGSTDRPLWDSLYITFGEPFSGSWFSERGIGRPLVRIRDLKTYSCQVWTTEARPAETVVSAGDVVAGMDAEFRPSYWLGGVGVLNQRCLTADSRLGGKSFALEALKAPLGRIEQSKSATTVIHLNKSDLLRETVRVPQEAELRRFSATAEPLRLRRIAIAAESLALASLRDTLLPHLMSGRITVRDAEKAVENA